MSCSVCKSNTHNKRKCPDKDKAQQSQEKRPMGRPRKHPRIEATLDSVGETSQSHHEATAQPTRVGRSGRVIHSARGGGRGAARGGGRGAARGGGRGDSGGGGRGDAGGGRRGGARGGRRGGGRSRAPQGFGVLFDQQGNAYTSAVGSRSGPTNILSYIINGQEGPSTQETVNQIV